MAVRILAVAEGVGPCYIGIYAPELSANILGFDSGEVEPGGIGDSGVQLHVCHVDGMVDRIGRLNCS